MLQAATFVKQWLIVRFDGIFKLANLENTQSPSAPINIGLTLVDTLTESYGRPVVNLDIFVILFLLFPFNFGHGNTRLINTGTFKPEL